MSQSTFSSSVSGPRPGENTWIWLIKIVTGPLLVIVIALAFHRQSLYGQHVLGADDL